MATFILDFLSGVLCAEARIADSFAVAESREGLGEKPGFLPKAMNRNATLRVAVCSGWNVTSKSTGC
jgi:hypothetical protein